MQSCSECTDAHNSRALLRIRPDVRHAPCAFPAQGRLRPQWSAHTHPVYNNVAGPPDPRLCRFRRRDSLLQASWHCGGLFPLKPFTSALFLVLVRILQQPLVLSDHLASEPVLQQQIAGAKAQRTSSIPRGTVLSVRPLPRPLYSLRRPGLITSNGLILFYNCRFVPHVNSSAVRRRTCLSEA